MRTALAHASVAFLAGAKAMELASSAASSRGMCVPMAGISVEECPACDVVAVPSTESLLPTNHRFSALLASPVITPPGITSRKLHVRDKYPVSRCVRCRIVAVEFWKSINDVGDAIDNTVPIPADGPMLRIHNGDTVHAGAVATQCQQHPRKQWESRHGARIADDLYLILPNVCR
jgi:hypothetical protein